MNEARRLALLFFPLLVAAPILFGFWVGLRAAVNPLDVHGLIGEGETGVGVATLNNGRETYVLTFVYARLPNAIVDSIVSDYAATANQTIRNGSAPALPPSIPPDTPCLQNCPAPPLTGTAALTRDLRAALARAPIPEGSSLAQVSDFHFVARSHETLYGALGRLDGPELPSVDVTALGLGTIARNITNACDSIVASGRLEGIRCVTKDELQLRATIDKSALNRFRANPQGDESVLGPLTWDTREAAPALPDSLPGKLWAFIVGQPLHLFIPTSLVLATLLLVLPALLWNPLGRLIFGFDPILPMPVLGSAVGVLMLVAIRFELVPFLGLWLLVLGPLLLYAVAVYAYTRWTLPWADYYSGYYVVLALILTGAMVVIRIWKIPWTVALVPFLASGQATASANALVRDAGLVFIGTLLLALLLAFGPPASGWVVGRGRIWAARRRARAKDGRGVILTPDQMWAEVKELGPATRASVARRIAREAKNDGETRTKYYGLYRKAVEELRHRGQPPTA